MSLGGSKDNSKFWEVGTTTGTASTSATQQQAESSASDTTSFLQQLQNQLNTMAQNTAATSQQSAATAGTTTKAGTAATKSGQTMTAMDTFGKAALDTLTAVLGESLTRSGSDVAAKFSKEQALLDSDVLMEAVMTKAAEKTFPQLLDLQAGSGTFNNTTTQLLRDKAVAQAAREAAQLRFDTIERYADISLKAKATELTEQGQNLTALLGALGLNAESLKSVTGEEATTTAETAAMQEQTDTTQTTQESTQSAETSASSSTQAGTESTDTAASSTTASQQNTETEEHLETEGRGQGSSMSGGVDVASLAQIAANVLS